MMWKKLPLLEVNGLQNPMLFYVSYSATGEYGEIYLTNFTKTWLSTLNSKEDFLNLKVNRIKVEDKIFVQHVIELMQHPNKLQTAKMLNEDNTSLFLELTSNYKFPLRLKIKFVQTDDTFFYNNVIQPMLNIIKDLDSSQRELRQLIEDKDKEVKKYKDEGAEIAFCYRTTPYNDEEFRRKHKSYEQFWDRTEISEDMLNRFYKYTQNGRTFIKVADNDLKLNVIGHSISSVSGTLKEEPIEHSQSQNGIRTEINAANLEIKTENTDHIKTEEKSTHIVENLSNTTTNNTSDTEIQNNGNSSIKLELPIKKEIKLESKNTRNIKRKKLNL